MDHTTFVRDLPRETREALTRRSTAAGLLHLSGHVGVIALLATLVLLKVPLWPVLMLPLGICICFLFTLQHEATHQTPFAHVGLNEVVGHGVGVLLLQPFVWFRYFHLAHHKHTNIPGKDPELEGCAQPRTGRAYWWHVSGIPYWIASGRQLYQNAFGEAFATYIPRRVVPRIRAEARWMLAVYAMAALSLIWSPVLLWVWIVPVILGQPFLRLYLLAEHGLCPFVPDMLQNSRTTFTNPIVRFLAWNMPYHTEHHTMPTVPFHRLPALHDEMRAHLGVTAKGYAAFTQQYLRSGAP